MRFFHHADLAVFPMRIPAIQAQVAVADVVALRADAKLVLNVEDGLCKVLCVLSRRAQQVERDPLG